ncbi:MAG: acyl-[ACP]--phospholipid O-acyltransferase [Magnetococcus sp. YQC-5]
MAQGTFHLLGSRRLLPLFVTQFLGALNDNIFKNALVMLIAYRLADARDIDAGFMVTLAGGLFILPYFLFSATAGQLADRMEKSMLIRRIKMAEIAIMLLAGLGLVLGSPWFLQTVLFLLGTQAAFFGPVKYAILPDHLDSDELIAGNGLIEAGTFVAILLGSIFGGLFVLTESGPWIIALAVLAVAILGWLASLWIPQTKVLTPNLIISKNFLAATWEVVVRTAQQRDVFLAILGISWFWLVGSIYLSQFPTLAKEILHGNEQVVTLFLTVFSMGIGLGSLLCSRLLQGEVSARYVPLGALGMTLFSMDLVTATQHAVQTTEQLAGVAAFLSVAANWRILLDMMLIAVSGGIYIVPLYAIMQERSPAASRSRIIAGNNILNALFMVASALAALFLLSSGFSVTDLFLVMAIANAMVALYICKLLPDVVLKALFSRLFKLLYRIELRGWEHFEQAGKRVVIVVNHVSFLDAALLAAFLPERPIFAINTFIAKQWWIQPFLHVIDAFPLDPGNPFAIKSLTKRVRDGGCCVIFPEGRITVTGALMKVYDGPGLIADHAKATILPIRIDGAEFTPFSRLKGKVRQRWFPTITLTMLPPRILQPPEALFGRARRRWIGQALHDLLTEMIFATSPTQKTLFRALLDARHIHGGSHEILEDVTRKPISYNRLITMIVLLQKRFATVVTPGLPVGLLMPNVSGTVATFFGLQALGVTPAMLNFSAGAKNIADSCLAAKINMIITSRNFVRLAKLEQVVEKLQENSKIVFLEDLSANIGWGEKLSALVLGRVVGIFNRQDHTNPHDAAVILFTSGSEGSPKGVVLSHHNLLSNCRQLSSRIDYNPTDIVFNALPIFHSFGLTGGLLLPLLSGLRTFLYPSPLHYRIIPEMVYDINATILFGTDTFLKGYARVSNPYDYYSVRYVFAGAEKVSDVTRKVWMDSFGLRIFEGYGATETSPALSANTAMHYKPGSVGRMLPGIQYRLEPVQGIDEGGRLVVRGPNVMKGYLRVDNPGVLEPPDKGWYDTGDMVRIDDEGYIHILGRVKRFAKIGGEMVSLTAVENLAATVWPGFAHAVVTLNDPRRGEQLVLVTNCPDAQRNALLDQARHQGVTELMIPKKIQVVDKIPLLGTGKTDYVAVKALVVSEG